jgi:hypothetical protein
VSAPNLIDASTLEDGLADLSLSWNRRLVALPSGPRCMGCGLTNPMVLRRDARRRQKVRCYRCQRIRLGYSGTERHHVGRRPSVFIVEIDANLHRILSYLQYPAMRAGVAAGSLDAVLWDLAMLCFVLPKWRRP